VRESRDIPAIASQTDLLVNSRVNLNNLGQVHLDKDAPRPTRKTDFNWNPIHKTLRITYGEDGKRCAEWVDLKFKAHGLKIWAQTKAQIPTVVSRRIVSPDPPLASLVNASPTDELPTSLSSSDESEVALEPPASPRTVVAEPHVLSSLTSEAWVDLAETKLVSRVIVDAETPAFSDSQFEQGQSSQWMVKSKEAEGGASMSRVCTDDTDGELASPLQCAPIAMVVPSGVLTVFEKTALEPSQWVKSRHRSFCKLVGFLIESHE
jgi:hypothetical protein